MQDVEWVLPSQLVAQAMLVGLLIATAVAAVLCHACWSQLPAGLPRVRHPSHDAPSGPWHDAADPAALPKVWADRVLGAPQ